MAVLSGEFVVEERVSGERLPVGQNEEFTVSVPLPRILPRAIPLSEGNRRKLLFYDMLLASLPGDASVVRMTLKEIRERYGSIQDVATTEGRRFRGFAVLEGGVLIVHTPDGYVRLRRDEISEIVELRAQR